MYVLWGRQPGSLKVTIHLISGEFFLPLRLADKRAYRSNLSRDVFRSRGFDKVPQHSAALGRPPGARMGIALLGCARFDSTAHNKLNNS